MRIRPILRIIPTLAYGAKTFEFILVEVINLEEGTKITKSGKSIILPSTILCHSWK